MAGCELRALGEQLDRLCVQARLEREQWESLLDS